MRSSFATFVTILVLCFGTNSVDAGIRVKNPFKKDKQTVEDNASVTNEAKSLEKDAKSQQNPNALRGLKKLVNGAVNGIADGVTDFEAKVINRQQERYGQPKLEKAEDKKASSDEKAADPKKKDSIADKLIKAAGCSGPKDAGWTGRCGKNALTAAADKRDADKKK